MLTKLFLYTWTFLTMFFGLFRNSKLCISYNIKLCILWNISFQNSQNYFYKFKWGRTSGIQKWRMCSLWKSYYCPIFSLDESCYCLRRFCWIIFLLTVLMIEISTKNLVLYIFFPDKIWSISLENIPTSFR